MNVSGFWNCLHVCQLTGTHSILCYYVLCLVIQPLRSGCPLPLIFRVFRRRRRCVHSLRESPFRKGWVGRNTSGHYHLPPDRRSSRGWSVLCGVSFAQLSRFCCCSCRTHSCWESLWSKGWVVHNTSGYYHLRPGRRSRRGWSVLCATFFYFLSSSFS